MDVIYLDNNATTATLPEVADAIRNCQQRICGNPASQHQPGRQARQLLEEAREGIAEILGARSRGNYSDRLVFTSGGTESNNLAISGIAGQERGRIVLSPVEHPSVSAAADRRTQFGDQIHHLPVDSDGTIPVEAVDDLLAQDTRLVSIQLANHETGVLQPVAELAARCRAAGVPLHTDAIQAVGKIPVSFQALDVAAMSISAHKFHGPAGIGALIVRRELPISPILYGGSQQLGVRAGTEPVALAVGMFKALQIWQNEAQQRIEQLGNLRNQLEARLRREFPNLVVNGLTAPRLPHVTSIAIPGLDRQALVMALDLAGIACSTGSACASGSSEPSRVLQAMRVPSESIQGSLRLSLSALTTESETEQACIRIVKTCKELLHVRRPAELSSTPPHTSAKTI